MVKCYCCSSCKDTSPTSAHSILPSTVTEGLLQSQLPLSCGRYIGYPSILLHMGMTQSLIHTFTLSEQIHFLTACTADCSHQVKICPGSMTKGYFLPELAILTEMAKVLISDCKCHKEEIATEHERIDHL